MSRIASYRSTDDLISTGGGGRGPHPPEPFGGGGGGGRGDGDDTPSHGERLKKYRMGLYFMLGSIMMLFVSFTSLFIVRRETGDGHFDIATGHFISSWVSIPLPIKLLAVNTVMLLLSSLTAELARRAAIVETVLMPVARIPGVAPITQTSLRWTRLTALFGMAFLGGQIFVWMRLKDLAERMDNPLSSAFVIILTGGHALHLFGGLMVLLYVSFSERMRTRYESRRIAVDVTAWYWHFMGAMWLYVLAVLAFIH